MVKDGLLWDDSALINAFDDAISKYKIMHGKGGHDGSFKEGKVTSDIEEKSSIIVDKSNDAKRHMEADDNNIAALKKTTEMGEINNSPLIEENRSTDSCVLEQHVDSSYGQHVQDADKICLNTQGAEDYNHLLNQYNELEEQRQKVLEQLYQYSSWNYQDYGYGVQGGTSYAYQEHQAPAAQTSYPTVVCSCRSYVCPSSTAPYTSLADFSSCVTCAGKTSDATSGLAHKGSSVSLEDGDLIKAAMGAAERGLCSLKTKASGISEVDKGKERDKEIETDDVGELAQSRKSETDLSVVLNAWFSAGFYTGKYIAEQSSVKK